MKKLMFKFYDLIDWIVKHKRVNFVFTASLLVIIGFNTNQTVLNWQYWAIMLSVILLILKTYAEGRKDENEWNKRFNDKMSDEVAKEMVKKINLMLQGQKVNYRLRQAKQPKSKKMVN